MEPLLDCVKTVSHCLRIAGGVLSTLQIDSEKMKAALTADMLATNVADYLLSLKRSALPADTTSLALLSARQRRRVSPSPN